MAAALAHRMGMATFRRRFRPRSDSAVDIRSRRDVADRYDPELVVLTTWRSSSSAATEADVDMCVEL
jgi:hypothetical protein